MIAPYGSEVGLALNVGDVKTAPRRIGCALIAVVPEAHNRQLAIAARPPSPLNYGKLKLLPFWDPLRGDPRFEKIVASLAPK